MEGRNRHVKTRERVPPTVKSPPKFRLFPYRAGDPGTNGASARHTPLKEDFSLMRKPWGVAFSIVIIGVFFALTVPTFAQSETATVSGRITDPNGQVVPEVQVQLVNTLTNVALTTKTNAEGLYVIANVPPGPYRILVVKEGFKEIVRTGLFLHVQDSAAENFSLLIGSVTESVTVTATQLNVDTQDATV